MWVFFFFSNYILRYFSNYILSFFFFFAFLFCCISNPTNGHIAGKRDGMFLQHFSQWISLKNSRFLSMPGCAMPTFEEPDVGSLADSNSTLPWQWQHGSALARIRRLEKGDPALTPQKPPGN